MQRRKAARKVFLIINKELDACLSEDPTVRAIAVDKLRRMNEELGDSVDELIVSHERLEND